MSTPQSDLDAAWLRRRLRRHVSELARLAWPVVVARCGILTLGLVDTIVVGHYGTQDLAIISLASMVFGFLIVSGIGLMNGTPVLVSHAVGREDWSTCGAVFRAAVPYGLVIGVLGMGVCFLGRPVFHAIGQPEVLAEEGGRLLIILGIGLPSTFLWTAAGMTLQALRRPMPEMVAMLLANLLNIGLDIGLVFGRFGLPELGAEGAAWASTVLRVLLGFGLLGYILMLRDRETLAIRGGERLSRTERRRLRRIGYGAASAMSIEAGSFSVLGLFAGLVGVTALAAYSIALNFLAIIFMVALGFSIAASVRVGIAYGRRDWPDMALAGWTGLALNSLVMAIVGATVLVIPSLIAAIYTSDPQLIGVVAGLMAYVTAICVFDGGQVVMISVNRARADVLVPTVIHVIAYGFIMIPAGWILGVSLGRGATGLFEAIVIASIVAAIAQALRFAVLQQRDRRAAREEAAAAA